MITVQQAEKIILRNVRAFPAIKLPLRQAYGLILRENLKADRDCPAFDKAIMDGIAIQSSAYHKGNREFIIEGTQAPGQKPLKLKSAQACIEILTGAALPQGTDCLVPVEQLTIRNQRVLVNDGLALKKLQYIRRKGSDHKKGETLLGQGCKFLPPQVAVAASIGKSSIKVSDKPRVAIISTGDELVDINQKNIQPFQTRLSNSYALQSAFEQTGLVTTTMFHLKDDKKILLNKIKFILKKFDVLVLSGGVSMGKFDYIPQVLKELGVRVLFHKVRQRPGKPFWFGKTKKGQPVFALPGNPVSTLVCAYRYVIPHLHSALGIKRIQPEWAQLSRNFKSPTAFTHFVPVKIRLTQHGFLEAAPVSISGSGDLASLAPSDGFIELPPGPRQFRKGFVVRVFRW